MELSFLEDTKKKVVFELHGGGHTICNPLKKALLNVKGVTEATYRVTHPLKNIPEVIVQTDGSITPKDAIKQAIKTVQQTGEAFSKQVKSL